MEEPHKAPLNSCTPACPGSLDATAEVAPLPSARTAKAKLGIGTCPRLGTPGGERGGQGDV